MQRNAERAGQSVEEAFIKSFFDRYTLYGVTSKIAESMVGNYSSAHGSSSSHSSRGNGSGRGKGYATGTGSATVSNTNLQMAIVSPVTSLGNTAADEARKQGERVAKAYADGLNSGSGSVYTAGSNLYLSGKNGADYNGQGGQMFYNTSANEAYKFAMGLTSPKAKAEATLGGKSLAAQGTNGAKSLANDSNVGFNYAGRMSGQGYVAGVEKYKNSAKASGAVIAKAALSELKRVLGIHSPSTAYGEQAYWSVMGYAKNMERYSYLAENAARNMAQSSLNAVETANAYTTSNAGYGIAASNQGAMADFMSNIYTAIATAMTGTNAKGDTVVMIDGKEVFRAVQRQERNNGVAIGNGAFV